MKTKRALEITIETHESTTIRLGQSQVVSAFCEICGMQTMHLPLADAVADLRSSETAILRLVETGLTHSHENLSGSRLICSNSLCISQKK